MDPKRIRQICAALRSGEYQQGQVSICEIVDGKKLHCVGGVVLDLLYRDKGYCLKRFHLDEERFEPVFEAGALISISLLEWMGCDNAAMCEFSDITQKLNDDGIPFSVIADRLERNYGLNPIRRVGISSEEPMNQAKIDGMKARSQGKPSSGNPFPAYGNGKKDNEDWRDGWECMNSQIAQTISNAERMFHGITFLKTGNGRVNGTAAYV